MTIKEILVHIPTIILVCGLISSLAITQFQVRSHTEDIKQVTKRLNVANIEHTEYKLKIENLSNSHEDFKDTLGEVNKTLNSVNSTLSGLQATIKSITRK